MTLLLKAKKILNERQWEEVFAIIRAQGLNASEFQSLERPSKFGRQYLVSQLFHLPSQDYFLFDCDETGAYYAKFCAGAERKIQSEFAGSWEQMLKVLGKWVGEGRSNND